MIRVVALLALGLTFVCDTGSLFAASKQSRTDELLKLAKEEFGDDLTRAEEFLFQTVCLGVTADFAAVFADTRSSDPTWTEELTLRADRVEWLCTTGAASGLIPHQGISVSHGRVRGRLDLSFATVAFPIVLEESDISEGLNLENADLKELSLAGSSVGDISGEGVRVDRDLDLTYGFLCRGEIRLSGAHVGGDLDLSGGSLLNPGPDALSMEGAVVQGDVLLRYDFEATGRVDLRNTRIHGNLDAESGAIRNGTQDALFAEGLVVDGDVLLHDGFEAIGTVDLRGSRIGGRLVLTSGSFSQSGRAAVVAEGCEVKSDLLLREGTNIVGGLDLRNTRVHGSLICDRATLVSTSGAALQAKRLSVDGDAYFGNADSAGSAEQDTLGETATVVEGRVVLEAATVAGTFTWNVPGCGESCILDLKFTRVGRLWFEPTGWPNAGRLLLHGLTYDVFYNHHHAGVDRLIEWVRRQPVERFYPHPYEQLASSLKKNGLEEEAAAILMAKEEDREREMSPARQTIHRLLGLTIGYGYDCWRALWIGGFIVLVGAIIFGIGAASGLVAATKEVEHIREHAGDQAELSADYPQFNAFVYSLDMFVPLLDLHQGNYWLPSATRGPAVGTGRFALRAGGLLRLYLGVHIYLGWALTTLLAVGLSGLVQG